MKRCHFAAESFADLPFASIELEALDLVAQQERLQLGLLLEVELALAVLGPVERRLGDVDVALLDQLRHLPVEEGQDQRPDVGAVDVRVGRDHELVVAGVLERELLVHAGPDRGDQRLHRVVGEHLVDPVLLDVDDLPEQRQHRLGRAVARLLGGASRGVALDDEQLGQARVANRAVGELARQGRVLERRLAAGQVPGLARGSAGAGGVDRLHHHPPALARVLLEELGEAPVDDRLDEALDRRVAELRLRLALELRVGELHRDHRGQPLADVIAGEVRVLLLEQALLARVRVQRPGQRRAEAREVRAALVRVDVVGEGEDRLLVAGVPLHRDLDLRPRRPRPRSTRSSCAGRPWTR